MLPKYVNTELFPPGLARDTEVQCPLSAIHHEHILPCLLLTLTLRLRPARGEQGHSFTVPVALS